MVGLVDEPDDFRELCCAFLNSQAAEACGLTQSTLTISLVVRRDYIHEAKLNLIVSAIKHIIPATMLEKTILKGDLTL